MPASAIVSLRTTDIASSYSFPIAPWDTDHIDLDTRDGDVTQQVWRISNADLTTLQIYAPLRQQLANDGFDVIFECRTDVCGGFDFRYNVDLKNNPDMQVDLNDFRYLAAEKAGETIVIFVSKTKASGFVQIIHIGANEALINPTITVANPTALIDTSIPSALQTAGHVVLTGLSFESGSSNLATAGADSLAELAAFLVANPYYQIAIVGHTDSSGSLQANIDLSRARAQAVVDTLINDYGVDSSQLEAAGMGYMSPLVSNLTAEGRDKNRRVEAVLTSIGED
ncbi:OmpA family protein [Marivivens niveibacter]|nr:OmpA family protein [Marivivens niveibacter]